MRFRIILLLSRQLRGSLSSYQFQSNSFGLFSRWPARTCTKIEILHFYDPAGSRVCVGFIFAGSAAVTLAVSENRGSSPAFSQTRAAKKKI
jgi:hypothetical protein